VRRLCKNFNRQGANGLVLKQRGKTSHRSYTDDIKNAALELVRTHYIDFAPTLASEYLLERHQINISKTTIRSWMIDAELWKEKAAKQKIIHQTRIRRGYYCDLLQIDGSPHDWFEGHGERCCLIVFIDDATSRIMLARFYKAETTFAYFEIMSEYIPKYG
jgi:hypothetical protein